MNLKRVFDLFLIVCLLLPFVANATVIRVAGLGGEGASFIVKDDDNVTIWPQLIRDYPNLAGGEISSHEFEKAFVNYDFGSEKWALQILFDKTEYPQYDAGPDLDIVPGDYNKLNVIFGRKVDNGLIGFGLNYAAKSLKIDSSAEYPSRDASYTDFGLSLGVTALERKLDLSVSADLALFSDKVNGVKVVDNDGSKKLSMYARYWHKVNERYALIPNVKLWNKRDSYKDELGAKYGGTQTVISAGCGNNWTPVEDMLAIFEAGLLSNTYKRTTENAKKDTEFDVYWRLGFESKIFSWLDGRFGAYRNWESFKIKSVEGEPKYNATYTRTYLGTSVHWNRFRLDALVEPAFIQKGPNFISGRTSDLFSQVSLIYEFDK